MALAAAGDPGNLWVTAGEQTRGRGRRGRDWSSPPGNLYASALADRPGAVPHRRLAAGCRRRGARGDRRLRPAGRYAAEDQVAERHPAQWRQVLRHAAGKPERCATGGSPSSIGCGINIVSYPDPGIYRATALNREGISATPAMLFAIWRAPSTPHSRSGMAAAVFAIRDRWLLHAQGHRRDRSPSTLQMGVWKAYLKA
jgi:BirA family biotin operon repressor/biotin-[acetyl-CoA-carboxylase] ligase